MSGVSGSASGLAVRDVAVTFGGLTAVGGVSLDAPRGRITGLIGPNGAGKTTLFNACTGLVAPAAGSVALDGVDLAGLSPGARARRGLGRTYQQMHLFDDLTVRENVALGREGALAGRSVRRQLFSSRRETAEIGQATDRALERTGIIDLAVVPVWTLSTGQRRLVELARALAGPFTMLMLDEPSSGLDGVESAALGRVLREEVADRDLGVLLVEHDMALLMDTCHYIYVLDFGVPIFEGTPAEVSASEMVRRAYLGSAP